MTGFVAAAGAWIEPAWPAPEAVRAVVTTRQLPGNSLPPYAALNLGLRNGEDAGIVSANRALLRRGCALPSAPIWLRQVHGTAAVRIHAAATPAADPEPQADAACTRDAGIVLAILTADCLPILVCADDGSEIAAVHAGWRGLAAGVVEACLAQLRTSREKLIVWLGPAIGAASYEVGDEVRAAFVAQAAGASAAFAPTRRGHWHCDLYTLARQRFAEAGVARAYGGGFDTFTDARFYSYRRDRVTGRFASLIWIDP